MIAHVLQFLSLGTLKKLRADHDHSGHKKQRRLIFAREQDPAAIRFPNAGEQDIAGPFVSQKTDAGLAS